MTRTPTHTAHSNLRCSTPITENTAICPSCYSKAAAEKLILPILRPGRGNKAINIAGLLKRLILKLRKKWKHTQVIFRGDSHFCSHDFMDWVTDRQDGIHFITGLAGNAKLKSISERWLQSATDSYEATGEEVRTLHSFMYKAGSWKHQQRVVVKIEVNSLGTNVRYVVTDFKGERSCFIYSECYCDRGAWNR